MAHVFGTGTGFGGGHGDSGAGDTPQFGKPASAPSSTPQHVGHSAAASTGDCHYFLQGTCTKGDSCLFRHNHAAKANGIVCRFWQNGFCKDAINCSFQHPAGGGRGHGRAGTGNWFASGRGMGVMRGVFSGGRGSSRAPLEAVDRSKQLCVFFAQGKCTKGDACPFSHATPPNDGTGQAVSRGIGPDKEQERAGAQEEHAKPVAEQPFVAMPLCRNDAIHEQVKARGTNGTVAFGGFSVRGNEECAPGARVSGASVNSSPPTGVEVRPSPFSAGPPVMIGVDGKTYVVGPEGLVPLDAVMRTMASTAENSNSTPSSTPPNPARVESRQRSTLNVSNDHTGVTVASKPSPSQTPDKAPGKSGIMTLPDGGFVTRKRAAEMQLLGDVGGEKDFRRVRQRNAQDQVNQQERRFGKAGGRAMSQAGGRPSIMDRLGPAKQPSGTSTSAEKIVGPARTRSEVPGQPAKTREEPRQQSAPMDRLRDGSQVNRPFPLSRPKALGTTRPTRRSDEGPGQSVLPGKPTVARPTANHKPAFLDFKIPTLDEIKSRKAKYARTEATTRKTAKAEVAKFASGNDARSADVKIAGGTDERSADVKVTGGTDTRSADVYRSHITDSVAPTPSVAKEEMFDPAPVAVPSDALQLEADMIEFREWL